MKVPGAVEGIGLVPQQVDLSRVCKLNAHCRGPQASSLT